MSTCSYWTYSPGKKARRWNEFKDAGVMALDFSEVGDLRSYDGEESMKSALQDASGDDASHKNDVRAMVDFRDRMKPGDIVFAKKGQRAFVGVGRVTGDYFYAASEGDMRHRRNVEWFDVSERRISDKAAAKALTDVTPYPGFLVKCADAYSLEEMYAESLKRLWDDFLAKWPIDRLRTMSLDEYNKVGSKESFCYWIENALENMGSVWGGSAFKFGIFEYDKRNPKPLDAGTMGDSQYRWYSKYGTSSDEVFENVRSRIVAIANAASRADYSAIDDIEFSPGITWKVAFLYQRQSDKGVIDIYKKEMLMKAIGVTSAKVPMSVLYAKAISMIPADMNHFVWARRRWLAQGGEDKKSSGGAGDETTATGETPQSAFDDRALDVFRDAIAQAGLQYDDALIDRFVAALCTKPFVVLSGLSGSGKTKLAQAFASWMSVGEVLKQNSSSCFKPGLIIPGARSDQKVVEVGPQGVVAAQGNGKCTCLSYEIINEWVETIKKYGYTKDTSSGVIKDKVISEHPKYSPYLHAFDPVLKALAFYQIENGGGAAATSSELLENVLLVPVGADWTNNEHLLGYPNALDDKQYVMADTRVLKLLIDANANPDIPFFLILDEMNLSHVERYFADFLSVMESKGDIHLYDGDGRVGNDGTPVKPVMSFPRNLYVIGTMNVDETTYMFSPKVLDRAQVIEFRVSKDEMSAYLESPSEIDMDSLVGKGKAYATSFLRRRDFVPGLDEDNRKVLNKAMEDFFAPLSDLGAEFGYRTAFEVSKFVSYYCEFGASIEDAIDAAVMQKLLPKLHGSQARLGPVLEQLAELCKDSYSMSYDKISRMQKRLEVGFTSFAEA